MRVSFRLVAFFVFALAAACASVPVESTVTSRYLTGRLAAGSNAIDTAAKAYADGYGLAPNQREFLKGALFFLIASGDIDAAAPYARKFLATRQAVVEDDEKTRTYDASEGLARIALAAQGLKAGRPGAARTFLAGDMPTPFLKSVAFLMDVWVEKEIAGTGAALEKLASPEADAFEGFNALHKALLADEAGRPDEARAAYQAAVFGLGGPIGRTAYGAFLERAGDQSATRAYYEILASEAGPARRGAEDAFARLSKGAPTQAFAKTTPAEGSAIAIYSHAGAIVEFAGAERARAANAGFHLLDPQFDLPLALARIALYLDPNRDEARRLVGWILGAYGDYDGTRAVLSPVPPSSPHFEQARIEMARALAAAGRMQDAVRLLKAAIRRDQDAVEAKFMLGQLHANETRYKKAVNVFTSIIDHLDEAPTEDAWRYFIARGDAFLQLGVWPEAETDLKRAVAIAPEEPTTLNYLGYSWAERGLNLDEAFGMIEKAVELEPRSGAIIDSLGWAHYQRGDYDEAVGHLEKAVAIEPSDPTITDHLGDAYWRLGRSIEARYEWRRALMLEPTDALKTALEAKLKNGLTKDGLTK